MARPLRLEYPGALYHVTARGNARQAVIEGDDDYHLFLDVLAGVISRFKWLCHAYCLMDNHYHLLIETPEGRLSEGMRHLDGVYTQRFNRRHQRVGHVFQGRFKAILVERESYLLELCRYVVLNPVRAKIVKRPQDYAWSSYRASAGLADPLPYLTTDWVLGQFGAQRRRAQQKYREFVAAGMSLPSPWQALRGQVVLGGENFLNKLQPLLAKRGAIREVPRAQRLVSRPALSKLFAEGPVADKAKRDQLIRLACLKHGYTLTEVADHLSMHYTTVSKIVRGGVN